MRTHITKGGQVSIPATVRHRWNTMYLELEDRGYEVVLTPLPADPVAQLMGSLPPRSDLSIEQSRQQAHDEEADRESARSPQP